MLVRQKMTKKPVTIHTDTSVPDALQLMHERKVHRLPVLDKKDRLVGIVSESDLLYASPSPATTLNVWEMHALLARLKVEEVMTRKVITVTEDTPVEEAAQIMVQNHFGGLPVVREKALVGIITETDLFKVFISLLGGYRPGVRVTADIPGAKGTFAKITSAIFKAGGDIVGLGFDETSDQPDCNWEMTIKVQDIPMSKLEEVLKPVVCKITDIRKIEDVRKM